MRIVQTLMAPIAAPVRKDTLEKESHAKVKIRLWFSRPDLVFLLSYKFHHMHTFKFFDALEYNTRGYAVLPI